MTRIQPDNLSQSQSSSSPTLTAHDPPDFNEGGSEHRKALLANGSLIIVLLFATKLEPVVLGVEVAPITLWLMVGITHFYFFVMWRLTAPIEQDTERSFWNIGGLRKQAVLSGTWSFPGKTKAQLFFIRALPIWVFLFGICGVAYGLSQQCAA